MTENPITLIRKLRREAAKEIERLIDFLDQLGGDPDIEENGDEQDQSYPTTGAKCESPFEDAEEDDAAEDNGDSEPILGSIERHPRAAYIGDEIGYRVHERESVAQGFPVGRYPNYADSFCTQENWGNSNRSDREDEHDGSEPDEDPEPTLGSQDSIVNQTKAWKQGDNNLGYSEPEDDRSDYEPSLGFLEGGVPSVDYQLARNFDQSRREFGTSDEREIDAGDRGDHTQAEDE